MKKLTALLAIVTIFTACKQEQHKTEFNDLASNGFRGHIKTATLVRYYNDRGDFADDMPTDTSRYTQFIRRYDTAGYLIDETISHYNFGSVNMSYKNVYRYQEHRKIAMDITGIEHFDNNYTVTYTWKNDHEYTQTDTSHRFTTTVMLDDKGHDIKDIDVNYNGGQLSDSSIQESEFDAAGRLSKNTIRIILPKPETYIVTIKVVAEDNVGNPIKTVSYKNGKVYTVTNYTYEYYDKK